MKRTCVGVATVFAVMALGCASKPARNATAPSTGGGGTPDETMTLEPTGEMKTFTPDPAKAAPREVPPDGTLRLVTIQFVTSIPDLEQRTSDAQGLADLIKAAERVVVEHDAARPGKLGAHAYVWIAVKPGRRVRAWLTGEDAVDAATERPIVEAIGKLRGPETRGLVVLLMPLARREEAPPEGFPPGPPAWQAAVRDGDTVEDAVARVWAD